LLLLLFAKENKYLLSFCFFGYAAKWMTVVLNVLVSDEPIRLASGKPIHAGPHHKLHDHLWQPGEGSLSNFDHPELIFLSILARNYGPAFDRL
jgi:hypothetical protein